jgi:uncharacterized protein (DUF427 family)
MSLMIKVKPSGEVIAQGEENQTVRPFEGNWYFAPETVDMQYLKVTERTYTCPYKGTCFWVDLDSPTVKAQNVAWIYREPKTGYEFIKDQVGFYARDTAGTTAVKA